jgi:glycosyltransferase involved in cell wall biosynthesis
MNICLIGKYPPIQGGVSKQNYWIARGLARKGHKVFVVTNADEVEDTFRIQLNGADIVTGGDLAPIFPESSGYVEVHSTKPPDPREIYYIPMNNPTVTRLATKATDLIRKEGCEVIFSHYLEPYGIAAYLASLWTEVPFVFKHAGSDLYHLACNAELQTAYLEVMYKANMLISGGPSRKQLLAYGVHEERIRSDISFGLPTERFNPEVSSVSLKELMRKSFPSNGVEAHFDDALPTLGIYGKLGAYKGSFDLLQAMAALIRDGFRFNLVALSDGWRKPQFQRLVTELNLSNYVHLLPFQPHWRIPEFIRSITAAAFLERDFPILAHGPTIPSEVIGCGKCLILSEEVARKQPRRHKIRNRKNIIVVSDPKRHNELAAAIRFALEDPQKADEIGLAGFNDLGGDYQTYPKYIENFEALLATVAGQKCVDRKKMIATELDLNSPESLAEAARRIFPMSYGLLSDPQRMKLDGLSMNAEATTVSERVPEQIVEISQKILLVSEDADMATALLIRDRCRFETLMRKWENNRLWHVPPGEHLVDFSLGQSENFTPVVRGELEIAEFSYDIEEASPSAEGQPTRHQQTPVIILFHRASRPMRVNGQTKELIDLISKESMTVGEIFDTLIRRRRIQGEVERRQLKEACLAVLESLYWIGIIDFIPPNREA